MTSAPLAPAQELPFRLEDTYARAVPALSVPWRADPAPEPRLLVLNEPLAVDLGLDPTWLRGPEGLAFLLGQVPDEVATYAQAYAGHQFGSYSPRLGDGRALLLGELIDPRGARHDLHLKGSGPTPFARRGDGQAVVGPMLREHLMGEAMHALGIPTTRALAVVATGAAVYREQPMPGAVLCRVAASHLRVGTFQYAAALDDGAHLAALADYAIWRHYPQAAEADNPYLALFDAVVGVQAALIARWLEVGFIHGVMNTDNMTISGQTIDYGPCAFMDRFDPATVFSSIDRGGRYAFGNQPGIGQWNLARLGEALLPLIASDQDAAISAAMGVLERYGELYEAAAACGMAAKLGLGAPDLPLVNDLTGLLQTHRVDFTTFFRALAAGRADTLFDTPLGRQAFAAWSDRRDALLGVQAADRMDQVNPLYIPRNHRVEEALDAATAGDLGPYERLLEAVTHPYEARPAWDDLAQPAPPDAARHVTYCGT